jgi:hypothetical protein
MGGMGGNGLGAGLAGRSGFGGPGSAAAWVTGPPALVVPGMGINPNNFFGFLMREATSSLVVVCGFNWAASCQVVSLPGAAPLSM